MGTPCRETYRLRPLQRLFYFVAITSENNALTLRITSVLSVESASGNVFESRSHIGRILLIAHLTPWLPKVRQYRQKTRLFSPHSLHNTEAGGVPDVDLGCGSSAYARDFSLQDFSPARRSKSRLLFSRPSSSFSTQDNGFLEISPSRPSVFDNATPPASSCFVNAHRAVFSSE